MKYILLFLILSSVVNGYGQKKVRNNAISLEFGKTGIITNLSFDHISSSNKFGVRAFVGGVSGKHTTVHHVGAGGFYLLGGDNRHLELGLDLAYLKVSAPSDIEEKPVTLIYPDYSVTTLYKTINLGYRAYGKSTLFRIGFAPGFIKKDLVPGGYVSLGLTF